MNRFLAVLVFACALFGTAFAQAASSTGVTSVGKTVKMVASADGTAPFTYVWQKTAPGTTTPVTIPSATSDTLTLSNVQLTDAGTYTCVVKNSAGQATGTAVITITPASPTTVSIVITIS